jgi:regulator of protease activity HflC (stomatin/prohibitin superfamily)
VEQLVNILPIALVILLFIIFLVWPSVKIVKQWERGIVLRFGRYANMRSPGLNLIRCSALLPGRQSGRRGYESDGL